MIRWAGRVAVVTGASAGIGAAIAVNLVKHGMKVMGIAKCSERVEELKKSLEGASGTLYAFKADVSKEEEVKATFASIKKKFGGVDVLVNNAGIGGRSTLHDGPVDTWRNILDINVLGLSMCTKEALQSMHERGVDDGHIIHIGSINGHGIPMHSLEYGIMMYSGSKHAVIALTEGIRRELVHRKSKIRVTVISPGMVKTEIMLADGFEIPPGQNLDYLYKDTVHLQPQDIADAVTYALGAPPQVQVHEIIIKPVGESF
ncbi:hypothetical protein L9F63_007050 [Diploptera punctata]|uniref:Farnesol dehydrogenase n=1 Tax=Diploptera punctata TaxID=6984 RepID=A0AAD8E3N8_DIPPU|nr:hypothetical protein L9F63_007050 [Diploptera punctata]